VVRVVGTDETLQARRGGEGGCMVALRESRFGLGNVDGFPEVRAEGGQLRLQGYRRTEKDGGSWVREGGRKERGNGNRKKRGGGTYGDTFCGKESRLSSEYIANLRFEGTLLE
jgi:hypothetical protein